MTIGNRKGVWRRGAFIPAHVECDLILGRCQTLEEVYELYTRDRVTAREAQRRAQEIIVSICFLASSFAELGAIFKILERSGIADILITPETYRLAGQHLKRVANAQGFASADREFYKKWIRALPDVMGMED